MPRVVLLILVILCAAIVAVALIIRRAPEGREGKGGFSYGTPERPDGSRDDSVKSENAPVEPPSTPATRAMKQ